VTYQVNNKHMHYDGQYDESKIASIRFLADVSEHNNLRMHVKRSSLENYFLFPC